MRGRKPSPSPKVSLTVQIDPHLLQRLTEAADDARVSRAKWVTLVLQDVLDSIPPDPAIAAVRAGGSRGRGAVAARAAEAAEGSEDAPPAKRRANTIVWDGG